MADVKISALTAGTALAGTEVFPAVQGGATVKSLVSDISAYIAAATETMTNKAFDTAGVGNTFFINGTAISAVNGAGAVSLTTGPVFVTPVLGVATGTSLALGGATIGTDALGITGTATISGGMTVGSVGVTSSTNPTNGIYMSAASTLAFSTNSQGRFTAGTSLLSSATSGGFGIQYAAASATAPTFLPNKAATTTGIGAQASGNMSLIAGGTEVARITTNGQIGTQQTTVASLPAAATAGAGCRRFVTDGLSPIFAATITGGGAVFTPVYSDGTNWRCG